VAEDKYSKARKARGLRKTILSPDDEPDTLKRAREEVRNTRGIETIKTGGKIMAVHMGKKKMAKGDMMKEEKMMKREGRGMAKADMQKMMSKKKYEEGGKVDMSEGVASAKADQLNFQRGYAKASKAQRQFNIKGGVDTTEDEADKDRGKTKFYEGEVKGKSDMKEALKGQGAYKKGGMAKKGYHKMPDGKMMKDS
jgi:hypothetical protein